MSKKTIWYCPCNCKTPKGMKKKFYLITTLLNHIIDNHHNELDIKVMYKHKYSPADGLTAVGKKRTIEEYEDGYKEILSVEEEEVDNELEGKIVDITKMTSDFKL